jgi:hypothetical protein
LANYNATGVVNIEANGGTSVATFGGATYNNDFVGTGRFTGIVTFGSTLSNGTYAYTLPSATGTLALTSQIPSFSGTTNYHAKFTSGTTIGNSLIWDNGTNVGIGNTNTSYTLDVSGTLRSTTSAYFATTSGSVGIGIAAPVGKLQVYKNGLSAVIGKMSDANILVDSGDYGNSTYTAQIAFGYYSGTFTYAPVAIGFITTSGTGAGIGDLTFNTRAAAAGDAAPTERMRITSGGNVGIGRTPAARLEVQGEGTTSSNNAFDCYDSSSNVLLRVRNDGFISTGSRAMSPINFTTASLANANIGATGDFRTSTASSQRFKDNIADWSGNGLETILALKPRTFNYKADYYKYPEVEMLGLIAEEVAEVSPYLAEYENEDRTGQIENVRYANVVVPLIKAIQELSKQNEELSNRLIKLESK